MKVKIIILALFFHYTVFGQNPTFTLRKTVRQQNRVVVPSTENKNYQYDNNYSSSQELIARKTQYDYSSSQKKQRPKNRKLRNEHYDPNRPQGLTLPEELVVLGGTYLNVELATSPNFNIYPSFVSYQPQRFFRYPTYNQPWNSLSNQIDRTRYLNNFNGGARVYERNPYPNNFIRANSPIGWFR